MMYKIKSFLIVEIDNQDVVIMTDSNVINITDHNIINFFKLLESNRMSEVEKKFIDDYFNNESDIALNFLLENNIIIKKKEHDFSYSNIRFITNNFEISKLLDIFLKGVSIDCEVITKTSVNGIVDILNDNNNEKSYNIIILNPFNFLNLSKISKVLKKNNLLSKIIFFYNYSFYFTNLYKHDWGTPCPICFFSNLESSLRSEDEFNSNIGFQTVMDIIYSKKSNFLTEFKYSPFELSKLIHEILKEVKKIENSDVNKIKRLDMKNNLIEYDFAYHWEMCDCYEN